MAMSFALEEPWAEQRATGAGIDCGYNMAEYATVELAQACETFFHEI